MNIFKDGVLVSVHVSFWSGARALGAEDLGLKPEDITDAFKLGKKFLIPSSVIRGFRKIEGKARHIVDSNSFPFPVGSARFIPRKKFEKVYKDLLDFQGTYMKLVDELVENYDKYRQEMIPIYEQAAEVAFINQTPEMATFGPDYDRDADRKAFKEAFLRKLETFYPPAESLRKRFSLDWDVYEIAVPRMKQTSSEVVLEEEQKRSMAQQDYQKQIHAKIGSFVEDVVKVLRCETVELCDRITKSLRDKKVIHGATLSSMRNFIDRFQGLNFVGDNQVEKQLDSLRKEILDVYPAERFKEDPEIQQELGRRIGEIRELATNMTDINSVTGEYSRKISWQD